MRRKGLRRLFFVSGIITWLILVIVDVWAVFAIRSGFGLDIPTWLPRIILNLYILSLFYYYKFRIDRDEQLNFVDLLWRGFATGLVATIISLALLLLQQLLGDTRLATDVIYLELNYLINLGLLVSFLIATFTVWKRLILYQKSKWLLRLWTFFEYGFLGLLIYDCVAAESLTVFYALLGLFGVIAIVLAGNMKWVAFLNYKQKWTSLLLLLLTLFYLVYIFNSTRVLLGDSHMAEIRFINHHTSLFMWTMLFFVLIYNVFSFLVILFNLPTTSVFEQKLEEVVNFQRISQSIQTEQSEESVYGILLETSVSTVFADAAWLEIRNNEHKPRIYTYKITESEANDIISHLRINGVTGVLDQNQDKSKNLSRHLRTLKNSRFRSILAFPIYVKGDNIGRLALLKELSDGFNKEMTKIVATFANQAGISIENFRLLEEALQSERYKEELKIAKMVQKSLLPQILEHGRDFEISAFSESADEVGGDYYDALRISESQTALIIADVSGKGTTAAFHMSQLKGIFHSLSQDCISPTMFMIKANKALVYCLERGSFISASFFLIDSDKKEVHYARAGHCPVLYYKASEDKISFLKDRGIALGMVKNNSFSRYIEQQKFTYQPGDVMVLYTDGITEARNERNEEFGYNRLVKTIFDLKDFSPKEISERLIEELYRFSGRDRINDDYTTMIVKF